jgi:hypothetical protein
MKVALLCNKDISKYKDLIDDINKSFYLDETIKSNEKDMKLNVFDKSSIRIKSDIYLILSDNFEEIQEMTIDIKSKNSIVIITENLASSHVLKCIEITPNICYAKNDVTGLIRKVYSCYTNLKRQND